MSTNDDESTGLDLETLVNICKWYHNLGWAVQEQLDIVLESRADECNNNALRMIKREFLSKLTQFDSLIDQTTVEDAILIIDMELNPERFEFNSEED